jgi:hypothetical protein
MLGPPGNYTSTVSKTMTQTGSGSSIVCGTDAHDLRLTSNVSTSYPFIYRIANNTILEFGYYEAEANNASRTTLEGLICLDVDTIIDEEQRCFSTFAKNNYNSSSVVSSAKESANINMTSRTVTRDGVTTFRIPVGQYFTGPVEYLAFVSVVQVNATNATAVFSNVKIKT